MKEYTVGFAFNKDLTQVALIRKNRPAWQAGKLNGIGGKVESWENFTEAQVREFHEETGVLIPLDQWKKFCTLTGEEFTILCYHCQVDLERLKSVTDESIEIIEVSSITNDRVDVIGNLPTLINLALISRKDSDFREAAILYK